MLEPGPLEIGLGSLMSGAVNVITSALPPITMAPALMTAGSTRAPIKHTNLVFTLESLRLGFNPENRALIVEVNGEPANLRAVKFVVVAISAVRAAERDGTQC
jgi:hypothetical protein